MMKGGYMKLFSSILVLGVILLNFSQAQAEGLRLGQPSAAGTGCPAGSVSANLSPDEKELSILFDSFVVEAGGMTGKRFDRKNCALSIPIHVPQGYSVSIFKVDYRGFNSIPAGGVNRINAEYFFAGSRGPRLAQMFRGPLTDNYTFTNNLIAEALVWSRCGDSVNLRVNADIITQTNYRGEDSMMTMDSADVSTSLIYHIQWKRCY